MSDNDAQSPPDSRMNRSCKHPDRLSLGRLLLSASLVTRLTRIVSNLPLPISESVHKDSCRNIYMRQGLRFRRPVHSTHFAPAVPADPLEEGIHCSFTWTSDFVTELATAEHRQSGLHHRVKLSGTSLPLRCAGLRWVPFLSLLSSWLPALRTP